MGKKKVLRLCTLLLIISFGFMLVGEKPVSAHEMWYNGTTPIVLKWSDVTNRTAKLKMNADNLHGGYVSLYSSIKTAWPNASARVSITASDFSSSNVDLATATEAEWKRRWGDKYLDKMGVCDLTSTDGYQLNASNANLSSKRIRYAGILYSPFESEYYNITNQKRVMVHEIGHAFGLGHPNVDVGNYFTSAASVMRTNTYNESYWTPQSHDINDLNNKY